MRVREIPVADVDRERGCCLELCHSENGASAKRSRTYLSGPVLRPEDEGLHPQMQEGLLMKVSNKDEAESFERASELLRVA